MKKNRLGIIAFVLSLIIIAAAIPVFGANILGNLPSASGNASGNASGEPGALATGDLDGNGKIESADARLVLRFAVELDTPTDAQKTAADVNRDGKVKSDDARSVLRVAVKLDPADFSKAVKTED